MPDFTVIEGGGKRRPTYEEYLARQASRRLVIELLRDLTREYGGAFATANALNCEIAWNKDPAFGVICIQSGPRG